MKAEFLNGRVLVKVGDITLETTDVIVNPANSTILGGGGVDGAIHRKGGKRILLECEEIRRTDFPNGVPTGSAVITTGGNLQASYVIHAVGPVYGRNGGRDRELLAAAYTNSLLLAAAKSLRSVAFPSISTGAFSFPKHEAASVSSIAIKEFLVQDTSIETIHLVFFSQNDVEIFVKHQEF